MALALITISNPLVLGAEIADTVQSYGGYWTAAIIMLGLLLQQSLGKPDKTYQLP